MKVADFKKLFAADSEGFKVSRSKNNRFSINVDGASIAVVDAKLSAKFFSKKDGEDLLVKYMHDEKCHVWETTDEDTDDTYYLISDGPDGAGQRGKAFSWDKL